ncbi:sialin-like [Tropilaelaps mercedesae]|uniref:Sialin-like n=1 Tax=Tropilaelaps mercedesae TaxID=418985 RepID=A0A1V9X2X6_9ACAR|nr:sialin-like [Tropilaelaps mercedesae]
MAISPHIGAADSSSTLSTSADRDPPVYRRVSSWIQIRYVLIALGFLGLLCVYVMRVSLNVAIVSMVNHTAIHDAATTSDCHAPYGHTGLIIIRALQGICEGVTYPAFEVQLARWIPKNQRSTAVSYVHAGGFVGVVVGMLSAGELAGSSFLGGWPSVFYVSSVVSVLWCFVWLVLITDTPQQHPSISLDELEFITNDLGARTPDAGQMATPWRQILCSLPVWSVHIAFFGTLYLQYVLIIELPTYLGTVLHFDIRSNGLFSSLPYVGAIIAGCVAGHIGDGIVASGWLSRTATRKLVNGVAAVVPSVILFLVVRIAGCDGQLSLILFVIAGAVRGMSEAGVGPLPIDMAPEFAGTVFGISVTIGALSGVLVPYITGIFINGDNSTVSWSYSFYVAGAVGLVSALIFQVFGTAEVQPWGAARDEKNRPSTKQQTQEDVMRETAKI